MKPVTPSLTPEQREALDLSVHTAVAAGAGSGKTFVLVERYLRALEAVRTKPFPISRVVAVTFTEKATAEMRARVRAGVRERLVRARKGGDLEAVAFWRAVQGQLHAMRITTMHAFCASVLRDVALDAGLDPDFEIADAKAAELLAEEAIEGALLAAAHRDPRADGDAASLERLLQSYRPFELRAMLTRLLARRELTREWLRRVEERAAPGGDAPAADPDTGTLAEMEARLGGAARRLRETAGNDLMWVAGAPGPRGDGLTAILREVAPFAAALLEGPITPAIVLEARNALLKKDGGAKSFGKTGRKSDWGPSIEEARERLGRLASAFAGELGWLDAWDPAAEALAAANERDLAVLFARVRAEYERLLGSGTRLDFIGLEERTADLFEKPHVRARLRAGIDFLLVDEFQDTSRLQWALLSALLAPPAREGDEAAPVDGPNLFVVGDDKQAIYEFRGGRVEVFCEAQAWIATNGGRLVTLAENFRTLPEVLGVMNHVGEVLFGAERDHPFEPAPEPLLARRSASLAGTVELLLHEAEHGWPGEADGIAARLHTLRAERTILDPTSGAERPIAWRDIAVIVPFRRDFTHLEDAFAASGIPFQVLGGLGFFQTLEVSDTIALLRVLLDPTDAIALAALLRSPYFAFADVDLWEIARAGEGFAARFFAGPVAPTAAKDRLAVLWAGAQRTLERWRAMIGRVPTSALLERAIEETSLRAVLAGTRTGPRTSANLEKLQDIVRDLELRGGIQPDAVLKWLSTQAAKVVDEGEATEIGVHEGVSILTIHKSKGCEFPVVVVAGLADVWPGADGNPLCLSDDERGVRIGLKVPPTTPNPKMLDGLARSYRFREILEVQEARRSAEMKRVLYVAATRARDHLLLSAQPRDSDADSAMRLLRRDAGLASALTRPGDGPVALPGGVVRVRHGSPGAQLHEATERDPGIIEVLAPGAPPASPGVTEEALVLPADALVPTARPPRVSPWEARTFSVSSLAAAARVMEDEPADEDEDVAPEDAIRHDEVVTGAPLGLEVHRILASLRGVDARWRGTAAATPHVRAFLTSTRARSLFASRRGFTEVPFGLPVGRHRLEGIIDRLYEGQGGTWTVLDFKTTRPAAGESPADLVARDRVDLQLTLYAMAAAHVLGLAANTPIELVAFFTHPRWSADGDVGREAVRAVRASELPPIEALEDLLDALAGAPGPLAGREDFEYTSSVTAFLQARGQST